MEEICKRTKELCGFAFTRKGLGYQTCGMDYKKKKDDTGRRVRFYTPTLKVKKCPFKEVV